MFPDRAQVQSFRFKRCFFDETAMTAHLVYGFDDFVEFDETVSFLNAPAFDETRRAAVNACLRLLHLAAGVSYYKAYIPERIRVESTTLSEKEADFFNLFYQSGLGEFSYRNQVDPKIVFPFGESKPEKCQIRLKQRTIAPVGGGKDSIVTLETLKSAGISPVLFSVGLPRPIKDTIAVSGLESIEVVRKISPNLKALNESGALNGHVPVTGIIAFILMLAAVVYDFSDVAMSNERSANVGNTTLNGRTVNHQWSKSIEFERAFADLTADVLPDFRYFSFLRPLSELSIARKFARIKKYDAVFTSCNKAFRLDETKRLDRWCGDCDKCRFVFLALAPFMGKERVFAVFARNPLNEAEQTEGFRRLLGLSAFKPFECVGEIDESAWAFLQLCRRPEWESDAVVAALKSAVMEKYAAREKELEAKIFSFSSAHLIPKGYENAVGKLEE